MRAVLIILGIVLIGAGVWIILGNGSYKQTDTLLQVGSAKVTATHNKALPPWAGIAGIVVGGLLAIGGFVKR